MEEETHKSHYKRAEEYIRYSKKEGKKIYDLFQSRVG